MPSESPYGLVAALLPVALTGDVDVRIMEERRKNVLDLYLE